MGERVCALGQGESGEGWGVRCEGCRQSLGMGVEDAGKVGGGGVEWEGGRLDVVGGGEAGGREVGWDVASGMGRWAVSGGAGRVEGRWQSNSQLTCCMLHWG